MSVRQLLNDILMKFDHVYDQVTQSEREEASKQALHEIVLEGEKPGSYGYHMKTDKMIDRNFASSLTKQFYYNFYLKLVKHCSMNHKHKGSVKSSVKTSPYETCKKSVDRKVLI